MFKPSRKIGGDVIEVKCRAIEINTNGIVSILIAFNFRYKSVLVFMVLYCMRSNSNCIIQWKVL